MRGPAAAEAGEVAGGADSLLFSDGDKDQDATSQRGDSPGGGGPRRHNSNTLKRRDAVSEPSRSEASVERRYSGESFAVEPTPHAESPSLGSSMPPSTERKRRDSEPLVKDSMPMGAADRSSPSASLDAGQDNGVERRSDHKPGAFTKFQQLQEEHRSKMAEKGAIIQQLEDDKSQLQADLRRLRKESASSEKREEEHRQTESQLSEARRQVRSLQEEKDRLAQRTSDEERKTEREREKRAEAERQLEDLQARLREREASHRQELERLGRERDTGLGGALDHLQSKLRATVESEIDAARTCAHAPAAETALSQSVIMLTRRRHVFAASLAAAPSGGALRSQARATKAPRRRGSGAAKAPRAEARRITTAAPAPAPARCDRASADGGATIRLPRPSPGSSGRTGGAGRSASLWPTRRWTSSNCNPTALLNVIESA